MKSESGKRKLGSVSGTFNLGENSSVETGDDCNCFHDDADVTMASFICIVVGHGNPTQGPE